MTKRVKLNWFCLWLVASAIAACFTADYGHLFAACCVSTVIALFVYIDLKTEGKK